MKDKYHRLLSFDVVSDSPWTPTECYSLFATGVLRPQMDGRVASTTFD